MNNYMPQEQEFTDKVNMGIWKRLIAYAMRYKGLLAALLGIMLFVSFGDVMYPILDSYAIDNFIVAGTTEGLGWYAVIYMLMVLTQSVAVYFFFAFAGRLEMRMAYDIRQDAFTKLQKLSFSYYDKTAVGYIHARVISDVGRLSEMIAWGLVDIVMSLTYVVGCIIIMFTLNTTLALIAIAVIPILAIVTMLFQKRILKRYRRVRRANSRITGAFSEGIMGAMTTKTLVREKQNTEDFKELTMDMKKESTKAAVLNAIFMPIVMMLGSIGTGFALYVGGVNVM